MQRIRYGILGLFILFWTAPALAQNDGVLLLGCAEAGGDRVDGAILVVSAADGPMPLDGGGELRAEDLLGRPCAEVLRFLLDEGLIETADIRASSHLVIDSARIDSDAEQVRSDADVPDCIIWDIDTANTPRSYVQLTCDVLGGATVVAQDTASSPGETDVRNFVGRSCAEALAELGGLANVVRSSIAAAPPQENVRQGGRDKGDPVSVLIYQLAIPQLARD